MRNVENSVSTNRTQQKLELRLTMESALRDSPHALVAWRMARWRRRRGSVRRAAILCISLHQTTNLGTHVP